MQYKRTFQKSFLMVLMSLCFCSLLYMGVSEAAQGAKGGAGDEVKESKTISGKVGFINNEFISIIDQSDEGQGIEHEILMYRDKDLEVKNKASLNEIKPGDVIQIEYEKSTKTSKDVRKSKQTVKSVKFLRAAEEKDSTLRSGKK